MEECKTLASTWAAINAYALPRRRFLQVAGVAGAAATLAACTPGGANGPSGGPNNGSNAEIPGPPWQGGVRGGRGITLWNDVTVNYDPPLAYGTADYYGLQNFFRGLMFYGPNAEPQLDIAKDFELSEDGLTYTFTLRDDVTFHNGRTVTAADFKWTFERSTSSEIGSWVQGFLASVEGHQDFVDGNASEITGIIAEDDTTLVLRLTKPDLTILGVLGIPPFYVLPKEEVERLGDRWSENPIGSGPFKLKSFDAGQSVIIAERYEDYVFGDDLPYVDEVEFRWNVTSDVGYLAVSKNEADLTYTLPASAIPRIKQDAEQAERFMEFSSFNLAYYQFDLSKAPFNDIRVRQAVNYALDREATRVFNFIADGHFYPAGLLGYDESAPVFSYDPDRARELLEEAGATDISFTLPVFGGGAPSPLVLLIQQNLKDVGINVELEQIALNPYDIGFELPNQYRMWQMGWGMGLPDPSELVSSLIGTGAPSNFHGYSNTRIDELGVAAISEADREARHDMYAEIENLLIEDCPILFIGVSSSMAFTSNTLENFYYEPILRTYWDRYWKNG